MSAPAVERVPGFALSPQQARLWALSAGESGPYRTRGVIAIEGALDCEALRRAAGLLVARFEILRTSFELLPEMAVPLQVIHDEREVRLIILEPREPRELPAGGLPALIDELLAPAAPAPAEPEAGGLAPLDLTLIPVGSGKHLLTLDLPALCCDRRGLAVLVRELARSYAAAAGGPAVEDEALQLADIAQWQNEMLAAPDNALGAEAFHAQGAAATAYRVPLPRRPAAGPFAPARIAVPLPAALQADCGGHLAALAGELGVPLRALLLAGWQALLGRLDGGAGPLVGVCCDGRNYAELEDAVGAFEKYLPAGGPLEGGRTFAAAARQVAALLEDLDRWQEGFAWEASLGLGPRPEPFFYSALFELVEPVLPASPSASGGGAAFTLAGASCLNERFEVRLSAEPGPAGLALWYDAARFDPADIALLGERLVILLAAAADAPELAVEQLALLPAAEQRLLTEAWSGAADRAVPAERGCVHERFEAAARRHPERTALVCEDVRLDYRQLDARANRIARVLRRAGIGPDVLVGLCADREPDLIAGVLGTWKAGGAYVPLDPALPARRLRLLAEEGGVRTVLGPERLAGELAGAGIEVIPLGSDRIAVESAEPLPGSALRENLCYVIFTSGSTGRPKGVAVEHRQLAAYLDGVLPRLGLPEGASYACVSTFAADLGHTAVFPALTTGGCLHLLAAERCTDPQAFRQYMAEHAVDCLKIVPGHLGALLAGPSPEQALPRQLLVLGGEAARWPLVDRVRGLAPGCAVLNHYGPTETTVGVLTYPLTHPPTSPIADGGRPDAPNVPLGRPLATAAVYLLDRFLAPVPAGAPGEVYLGGEGVARGYAGRPDLTAAAFVPHPWGAAGERLYRTGDLARFLPDGNVEFLGRTDHQVKIRGFRVEPGEVAAVLERHPAVQRAVVTARTVAEGERQLVAYAATGGRQVEPAALRAYLEGLLPSAMVPSALVLLDRLPLTANGKVDLATLPAPDDAEAEAAPETAPRTATEERLLALWRRLLGAERLSVERSFFELGGHSLLAMRLVSQVSEAFGVDFALRAFIEEPTIAGMAAALDRLQAGAGADPAGPALPVLAPDPAARHQPFPLTDIQQAYWIGRSGAFELGNVSTHAYLEFDLPALDLDRLTWALRQVVDRHEMLRAVVLPTGEQQILPSVPPYEIELLDLRGLPSSEAEARLAEVRGRMSHQVLPTDRWPLFEVRASRLADRFRLHVSSDALVRDAWSFRIVSEDLLALYLDPETPLPPLEVSFRDYVLAETAFAATPAYARSLAYWQERLATLPPAPQLPLAVNPSAVAQPHFTGRRGTLEPAAWGRLKERASRAGLSPTGFLLAVFSEVLAAWSKSPRFTVNLTLFNRFPIHPQIDRVVGDFTSLLLAEVDAGGGGPFEERARRVQARLWDDLDHRHVSGVRVMRDLMRRQGTAGRAVMPVVFTSVLGFAHVADPGDPASALGARQVYAINQTPQVWLDHQVLEEGGALVYQWAAVEELFPLGLLDDMFAAFGRLLAGLSEEAAWCRPVPLLVPAGQLARRAAANATDAPISGEMLHSLVLAQAARTPDRPAVIAPGRTLTYGELERWSAWLAGRLRGLGAGSGRLVAVVMEKGWEQAAAALGVLRAGAAYLPIDPHLPRERFHHLLERGEVTVALVQPEVEVRLAWPAGVVRLAVGGDEVPEPAPETPATMAGPAPSPGDLAYVIFTSGSTGQPKGVMIDHRGAVNTVLDVNRRFGVAAGDRVLALSALNFDLSVYDLFGPLAAGGALVLPAPSALRDPAAWTRQAAESGVTLWNTVPALMEMWVEYLEAHRADLPAGLLGGLRLVLLSGDWISVTLPDRIRSLFPAAEVISLGGATEASIWSILYPVGAVDPAWRSIPYGRPMANQTFHVLVPGDPAGETRPDWVPGELAIGGIGVALGYWRDAERTAASFFLHPANGERLYRTGDQGRYLPSGDLEFLGREDLQVKVQGHRIELGEIESALLQHPGVQACAVAAPSSQGGPRRLVAYVVARQGAPAAEELRAFLLDKLPAALVPAAWVFLPALPLSVNGKVDRAALPELEAPPAPAAPGAAASGIALRIAELVARALKVERIDPAASLADLGASSIDMVRIANLLEDEFGFRPRMNDLFQFSIVGAVSEYYEALLARGEVYGRQAGGAGAAGDGPWSAAAPLRDPEERDRFKKQQPGLRRDRAARPRVALAGGPLAGDGLAAYLDRRSHRRFAAREVPRADFSRLLSALRQVSLNAAPKYRYGSAGGLYPVQAYLYVKPGRVEGLAGGTYYYDPVDHSLSVLVAGAEIPGAVYGWISQPVFEAGAFAVYLVAETRAIVPMYGERSRDFSLIEAGLVAQLLETQAAECGIGLCQIGGVEVEPLRPLLDLEESHALLHSLVGGPLDRDGDEEVRRTADLAGWEEGRL